MSAANVRWRVGISKLVIFMAVGMLAGENGPLGLVGVEYVVAYALEGPGGL